MEITQGPFKGTPIPAEEIVFITNPDTMEETAWWPVAARTQVFLEKFAPQDGWSVEVENGPGPFNLPDYRNQIAGQEAVLQPTWLFTTTLKHNGVIVNQASSLEVIDGPKAWERGETNARGRLYDSMGLPGNVGRSRPRGGVPLAVVKTEAPVITPVLEDNSAQTTDSSAVEAEASQPDAPSQVSQGSEAKAQAPGQAIDRNLLQQIHTMARIKGIQVPASFADAAEAKQFLKDVVTAKVSA